MIHYTLLPKSEIKILKKEYRMRLAIFALFFISAAIVVGIYSLAPAFIVSYSKEKQAVTALDALQKSRKENGIETIINELKQTEKSIQNIKAHEQNIVYSEAIAQIISHKSAGISLNSFQIAGSADAKGATAAVIQGKASSRDSLIAFRNKLEADALISGVDLPVSDLAKNKDISFSMKLLITSSQ